jgi:outer membrane receptor protein involved in Fe transport
VLVAAGVAIAQETKGTIAGRVVDAQGLAVPGATVTVIGGQGSRTAITNADGHFTVPFVAPGEYTVRVELTGFKTAEQKGVAISLGFTADLAFTLQLGEVKETVNVTAASPLVDTTSTTVGATLDTRMLDSIPVGRRFSETLYVAPGVSSGGTVGAANPSVSGGSGLENAYVVDGVNITNAGYGALGSYSIIFGSLGNGTPYDFMQEVQVKSGGYEAEYGKATGGVVNVVTKSGSNKFSGTIFGYSQLNKLQASYTQVQTPNGTVNTVGTQQSDGGAAIGGPIIHSRLFFFGAIDPQWQRQTMIAPDGFPLGNVDRDRHLTSYAAKISWQASANHHFDASFFGDPAKGDLGPQRNDALLKASTSGYSELTKYGGNNQMVRYEGTLKSNWLIEAAFAAAVNDVRETPSVDSWQVTDRTVTPNVRTGGIGSYEAGNHGRNLQYQAKSTHLLGGHQLSYGFGIQQINYNQINQRTGPTFALPTGEQTATGAQIDILPDPTYGVIYRVVRANLNAFRETTQLYTSLYAEDTWRIGSRFTLKPGIRYERQRLDGTIAKNFVLDNNWAPRVGAIYDMMGNGRSKIYGNFGIYYAPVPNDLAARALSADAGVGADYFDANLTQPVPDGVVALGTTTHYSIAGAGSDTIDPNVKMMYMMEFIAGYERQLGRSASLGIRYINRRIPRVLEDVSPFPIVAGDLKIPGAASVDYTLTNPSPSTPVSGDLGASFEKPIHHYDAVEVTFAKRFSQNWAMQASYRWSRLWGTYEGFYRDDNGQSDPGITSLYDFPTNDPSYTQIGVPQFNYLGDVRYQGALGAGLLPLDRTHQGKIFGNYSFKMGLNVGVGVNLSSGKPLTSLAANPNTNYQNGGEIPMTPRGQGFQTVDGFKTRTPFQSQVDAHVDYTIHTLSQTRLTLLADLFNLFDQKTVLDYDNFYESTFKALNPNFGQPVSSVIQGAQIQTPFTVRLGVRFNF